MNKGELKVSVYAAWLEGEPNVGTLYCNFSRGNEVQSFEFAKDWLRLHSDIMLCPDLYNTTGRQYVPQGKKTFGMFADCSPDRWGRKLLQRREAITASALAVMCGINATQAKGAQFNRNGSIVPCAPLTNRGTTFLSKRFDREYTNGKVQRVHYASAMTMLGRADGGTDASYLDIASFIKEHGTHPKEDLRELRHRVLFNVLVSNTDDHLRNHGFLLDGNGFRLSPAFEK